MTAAQEEKLKSLLQTLVHVSYSALIQVHELKKSDESKLQEIENYRDLLQNSILEIFE